jgi:chromosome segregation ATPase
VEKIKLGAYFQFHGFEVNSRSSDLYFWGVRSESAFAELEDCWESHLDRLSRSQGQLAQAAARHASVQAQLDESRYQFAEAKAEVERAKVEAQQAKDLLNQIFNSTSWSLTLPIRKSLDILKKLLQSS